MRLLLERFNQLVQSYEASLQNQLKIASNFEKQITYLVNVTNSLFSYGLPSANSKFAAIKPKSLSDGDMADKV